MIRAIVLAAGTGKRFGPMTARYPKCLIPLGNTGHTLLGRYLDMFRELEIRDVVIVVGHLHEKIRRACNKMGAGLNIRFIRNKDYRRGSVLSLWSASPMLDKDVLIMDADVYLPAEAVGRLIAAPSRSAFLLDTLSVSKGEEMMVMARDGKLAEISKQVIWGLQMLGEATGILKLSAEHARKLRGIVESYKKRGILDVEYEMTYCDLMKHAELGFVNIAGTFWTEMDFRKDLEKILAHEGALKLKHAGASAAPRPLSKKHKPSPSTRPQARKKPKPAKRRPARSKGR